MKSWPAENQNFTWEVKFPNPRPYFWWLWAPWSCLLICMRPKSSKQLDFICSPHWEYTLAIRSQAIKSSKAWMLIGICSILLTSTGLKIERINSSSHLSVLGSINLPTRVRIVSPRAVIILLSGLVGTQGSVQILTLSPIPIRQICPNLKVSNPFMMLC